MEEEGQEHWYSGKMLERLIGFLEERRVVEVGRGHNGVAVSTELDDDGEGAAKKG